MFIEQYYQRGESAGAPSVSFTREQGSEFAKGVACDFNPLHDADATRFCIPGDLLFALVLARYGLSQHMEFEFSGMVTEDTELLLPEPADDMALKDEAGKEYLLVARRGEISHSESLIQTFTRAYVEYSGETFPHILDPLMSANNAMINYARPMVMYQSMTIDLDRLDIESPRLEADHNELDVDGRRGAARLHFNLLEGEDVVGRGCKRMLLSGLREYDAEVMALAIADYDARKAAYTQT